MEGNKGRQQLARTLTIVNLVLLAALVVIAFIVYANVRNTIQTVDEKVEDVTGVVQNLVGGDELQAVLEGLDLEGGDTSDLETRLKSIEAQVGSTAGGSQPSDANTSDLEARLKSVEAQVGSTANGSQPADADVLFQVFPELQFDGMLSDGCVDDMRSAVARIYSDDHGYSSSDRRQARATIDAWGAYPYSQLSNQMLYEIGSLIDAMAYSRGWSDWQGDSYRVYDRSHDEDGAGASGTLPCMSEREDVSLFANIRSDSPMSNFRGQVVDDYWRCVERVQPPPAPTPTPEYYEGDLQGCRLLHERYAHWLPPLPAGPLTAGG